MKIKLGLLFLLTTQIQSNAELYSTIGRNYTFDSTKTESQNNNNTEIENEEEKLCLNRAPLNDFSLYSHIFTNFERSLHLPLSTVINANAIKDLMLLQIAGLFNPITGYGNAFIAGFIASPLDNISVLTQRQNLIKELVENKETIAAITPHLQNLKTAQESFFYFFEEVNNLNKKLIADLYWKVFPKPINNALNRNTLTSQAGLLINSINSTYKIWLTPLISALQFEFKKDPAAAQNNLLGVFKQLLGHYNPLVAVNPALELTNKKNIFFKATVYGGLMLGIDFAYKHEKVFNNLTNYLHEDLNNIALMIASLQKLDTVIQNNEFLKTNLTYAHDLHALFDPHNKQLSDKMKQLFNILSTSTFRSKPSYFCLKGRVVIAHKLMRELKQQFIPALHAAGEIDAYIAFAKVYQGHLNTEAPYTFVEYIHADAPSVVMENMWNPLVNTKTANKHLVKNSIKLGKDHRKNAILTGPNAGGKSTFLKGITISIVLGQTIGFAPVSHLAFTPFAKINTYMNITDDTAAGKSLFKTEVERAQELLSTILELGSKSFSFSIMDEMFSGTTPKEGAAASYAVAKKLASCTNSIILLASHFSMLKDLEKETVEFKNYQVRVIRHKDGSFSYPFKLEEGFADQNVAIDLLKQEGFNVSILNEAQAILKR